MSLELINDSIKFARELAIDLDYRDKSDDKIEVVAAVRAMNEHLFAHKGLLSANKNFPTMLHTQEVFLDLPDPTQVIERLPRAPLMSSRVEKAVVSGNVQLFRWIGSSGLALFGIQLSDADLLEPHYINSRNAFVPVRSIESVHV